jgi:hypothetical protein
MIKNIASEIATLIGKKAAKTAEKTKKPAQMAVGLPVCKGWGSVLRHRVGGK